MQPYRPDIRAVIDRMMGHYGGLLEYEEVVHRNKIHVCVGPYQDQTARTILSLSRALVVLGCKEDDVVVWAGLGNDNHPELNITLHGVRFPAWSDGGYW